MQAFASDRHGGLDTLGLRELPRPVAGPGEVLVEVHAAALNPADDKVLAHKQGGGFLHASVFPLILGFDFSGVVVELGAQVTGRAVGDLVFGFLPYARSTRGGTFAEYVAVDARTVGSKPATVAHADAAVTATVGVTALQGLRAGRLAAGQTILINGASGGVGGYAIQLAKARGATVVATASVARHAAVRALGADRAIDYKVTPMAEIAERCAMVFDVASLSSYGACVHLLEPGGTYITLLPSAALVTGMLRALVSSRRCKMLVVKPVGADLDELGRALGDGTLKASVDATYPLAELVQAFVHHRDRGGKIAISVRS